MNQSLHAVPLGHQCFVVRVVAGEVGQDACGTGQHVDVLRGQQADQILEQMFHSVLQGARERASVGLIHIIHTKNFRCLCWNQEKNIVLMFFFLTGRVDMIY